MTRARRIVKRFLIGTGLVLALVALFVSFAIFTTPGARLALAIANRSDLPVRARTVEGSLARRFELRGVEVRVGPVEALADTVTVEWRPLALRDRRVEIVDATVAGVRVVIHSDGPDSAQVSADVDGQGTEATEQRGWKVWAERLRVRDASVNAPGGVRLHDVAVDASGEPDAFRADVVAAGSVWRFDDVRVFVRASGSTQHAAADSLEVRTLGGAVRGEAFVRWEPHLSGRGRLHGDSLRVGELADTSDDWLGAIAFRAKVTGSLQHDSTRVGLDLESLEGTLRGRALSARGRVDVDSGRIEASDATLRWGSAHATLSGSMAEIADVRLDVAIPSLAEILPRARGSAHVRGRIAGTAERIDVKIDAGARDLRAGRFDVPRVEAALDATVFADDYVPHGAEVRRADVRIADGRLQTTGTVSWRDGIEWDVALMADRLETSTLTPARWNLYGPVSASVSSRGVHRKQTLRARAVLASLSGTVRDRTLAGTGDVAVSNGAAEISALRLAWGDLRLNADGHAGDTLRLDVDVTAPDLSMIDSTLGGALSLGGSARGPRRSPTIDAVFTADSLRVREYSVHRLEGSVDASLGFVAPSDVHVLALGASRGETSFDTVRVDLDGPREGHRASLYLTQDRTHARLTLRGTYADTTWAGWIDEMRFSHDLAGTWSTRGRAPVFLSRSRARVDSLSLARDGARIDAHAAWQRGDTAHVHVALHELELSSLAKRRESAREVTGTLDGVLRATIRPTGSIDARVDLTAGPGRIAMAGSQFEYRGRVTGTADEAGVSARVDLDIEQGNRSVATVDADVSIPGFVAGRDSLGPQPIEGRLDLECGDVGPMLSVLAPGITRSSGAVTAHVTPRGTAGDFRFVGSAALERGRFDLPNGLFLRDVALSMVSDGQGSVTMEGGATSGGGRVTIAARSARSQQGWIEGTFSAQGKRFQLINQPEAQVFVSPDLEVRVAEHKAEITGQVDVPFARIETAQVPSSAVSSSNDVVFVEDTLATRSTVTVHTKVRVALGDSVTFDGFGLRGRLAGSIEVEDERGHPTRGTGEIQIVKGKYRAFGSELTIDPGRFVFGGGAIDDPGLDVRAYRGLTSQQNVMTASGEIVGVNLRGTLRRPALTVFSNPPMSESEIMSYLMFGRPMSTGSGSEQSALASAASLIAMQQGTEMAGGLGKRFALDDAYLESGSEAKETSFVAGKYLSAKLYVSYAAGLFENTNTFRVRYSLTNSWTLQAESGDASSTDILYRFERGK
jgi:translocation and assembly module TamB